MRASFSLLNLTLDLLSFYFNVSSLMYLTGLVKLSVQFRTLFSPFITRRSLPSSFYHSILLDISLSVFSWFIIQLGLVVITQTVNNKSSHLLQRFTAGCTVTLCSGANEINKMRKPATGTDFFPLVFLVA